MQYNRPKYYTDQGVRLFNTKSIIIFFILSLLFLVILNFQLKQEVNLITLKRISDQLTSILRTELDKEKQTALGYALLLSSNEALIKAMEEDEEERGYAILSELMHSIKQYTHDDIRAQVITSDPLSGDYLIFARSWDNTFAGMPIDEYRPDLQYFLENKKPRSAIETGRRLGIKATVPIYKKEQMLGFIEILQFFENTTNYFRQMGVELYILMDERFYGISIFMQENPYVGTDYIIANRHYSQAYLEDLEQLDMQELRQTKMRYQNKKYFFYEPMLNGVGESIGAFVMVMPEKQMEYFTSKDDELSLLINFTRSELYEITKKKYGYEPGDQSNYDKELLYLKDVVDDEDKELFMDEARDRLGDYSKDELIGMILDYDMSRQINGEIK